MNKPLMEEFLNTMLKDQNYQTAFALRDMLDELVSYRRDKLIDEFNHRAEPFKRVGDWKHLAVIDHYFTENKQYAIDVIVTKSLYQVQFFERIYNEKSDGTTGTNPADPILEEIGFADKFFSVGSRREIQFRFPEEEKDVYIFLRAFIDALKDHALAKSV